MVLTSILAGHTICAGHSSFIEHALMIEPLSHSKVTPAVFDGAPSVWHEDRKVTASSKRQTQLEWSTVKPGPIVVDKVIFLK